MSAEDAAAERKKGNYVVEEPGKGFRRVVSAPNPVSIVEIKEAADYITVTNDEHGVAKAIEKFVLK